MNSASKKNELQLQMQKIFLRSLDIKNNITRYGKCFPCNCNQVLLVWKCQKPSADCKGCIEREVWGMESSVTHKFSLCHPHARATVCHPVIVSVCHLNPPRLTRFPRVPQSTNWNQTHSPRHPKDARPFCLGSEGDTEQFVNYGRRVGAKIALYQIQNYTRQCVPQAQG